MLAASDLAQRFEQYIISEKLLQPEQKILIGFSGGADSTALLHLLYLLKKKLPLQLIAVHINHQLRGEESDADESFVRQTCARLNVPAVIRKIQFESRRDLENQAREKRLEIMQKIMELYRFDLIAFGHQKNDQAETVLMNLARGTGITGMGGMFVKNNVIIRPLLIFSKTELENWLQQNKISWRIDTSNKNSSFIRNRIRNELIPWFENNLNPSIVDKLSSQASIFQQTDEWIKANLEKVLKRLIIDESTEQISLSLDVLKSLSDVEQFYALRNVYSMLGRTEHEFFHHSYQEVRKLFDSQGTKCSKLAHGVWVIKQYEKLMMSIKSPMATELPQVYEIDFEKSHFVFLNWRFTLRMLKKRPTHLLHTTTFQEIILDLNSISLPLTLRTRQSGDRFIPYGMSQEKKLKDFFIDEKVPKYDRDKVPILTDGEKILWVVGYRLDQRAVCPEDSHKLLHITAETITTLRKRSASRTQASVGGKNELNEL